MPTVAQNLNSWTKYDWSKGGEEWSEVWGGSRALWHGTIMPRIQAYLPAKTILEIAPGYGRCTQFLVSECQRLKLVDLAENCIEACKDRFHHYSHIDYYQNNGLSLDMLPDDCIDFAFSWDSLVHVEMEVITSYLAELARTLRRGATGFLHHSNIGAFWNNELKALSIENKHWRGVTVSATKFRESCLEVGLECFVQEIFPWGSNDSTDCISVFRRPTDLPMSDTKIFENSDFMRDARSLGRISRFYENA